MGKEIFFSNPGSLFPRLEAITLLNPFLGSYEHFHRRNQYALVHIHTHVHTHFLVIRVLFYSYPNGIFLCTLLSSLNQTTSKSFQVNQMALPQRGKLQPNYNLFNLSFSMGFSYLSSFVNNHYNILVCFLYV